MPVTASATMATATSTSTKVNPPARMDPRRRGRHFARRASGEFATTKRVWPVVAVLKPSACFILLDIEFYAPERIGAHDGAFRFTDKTQLQFEWCHFAAGRQPDRRMEMVVIGVFVVSICFGRTRG